MKKVLACLLALSMVFALCACGSPTGQKDESPAASAQELLGKVWDSYGESDKFAAAGGDADNAADGAPGKYGVTDAAALDSTFGLPASAAEKIDDAASLVHMMNANTFTGGAFHLKDEGQRAAFADEVKTAVLGRQWLCGFPDTLVIIGVGDYVISVFGSDDLVQAFKDKTLAAYGSAELLAEESLAF